MKGKSFSQSIGYLLLCSVLMLTACAEDAFVDFSTNDLEDDNPSEQYAICDDNTSFEDGKVLETSDFVGAYVATRELVCGVAGCNEAPFVFIQFAGFSPSLELSSTGEMSNPDGPFEKFENWTFNPAVDTDVPNRLMLVDDEAPDNSFQVTIMDAGPCRLRLENAQGWIEYKRLEEL